MPGDAAEYHGVLVVHLTDDGPAAPGAGFGCHRACPVGGFRPETGVGQAEGSADEVGHQLVQALARGLFGHEAEQHEPLGRVGDMGTGLGGARQ